jgi:hypothetical protein
MSTITARKQDREHYSAGAIRSIDIPDSKLCRRITERGARACGSGTRRHEGRNLKTKHESLAIEQQVCLGSGETNRPIQQNDSSTLGSGRPSVPS